MHIAKIHSFIKLRGRALWKSQTDRLDGAIPWPCLHEFLAVLTNPRIYRPPTPMDVALDQAQKLIESLNCHLIGETDHHWERLRICIGEGTVGRKVHDAKIAAICLQHGVREFWSADRDFSRFPELKTVNPLL